MGQTGHPLRGRLPPRHRTPLHTSVWANPPELNGGSSTEGAAGPVQASLGRPSGRSVRAEHAPLASRLDSALQSFEHCGPVALVVGAARAVSFGDATVQVRLRELDRGAPVLT